MSGGILPIGDVSAVDGTGVEARAGGARGPRDVAHGAFLATFARIVAGTVAGERRSRVDPSNLAETAEPEGRVDTVDGEEAVDATAMADTAGAVDAAGATVPAAVGAAASVSAFETGVAVKGQPRIVSATRSENGSIPPDGIAPDADPDAPPRASMESPLTAASPNSRATAAARGAGVVPAGDQVTGADPEARGARSAERARVPELVDPSRSERSLDLLDADFRVRLERVIDRMEREYGHRVSIVETFRHQDRQDHLFEQGRTRPGDVVTWTRHSNHTRGTAADVIIDGSYGNPSAYARLRLVAVQEGLDGLGARDPGHLELPSSGVASLPDDGEDAVLSRRPADAGWRVTARAEEGRSPARIVPAGELARPAPVATVARVAAVETPRIAAVAVPGRVSGAPSEHRSGGTDRASVATGPASAPPAFPSEAIAAPATALATPDAPRFAETTEPPVTRAITSASAERIAHLLDLDSSTPLKPLHQVLLRLEGATGEDRIRLELQGNSVGATIEAGDRLTADRLGNHLGELRRALERQGLEAEALQVRTRLRGDGQNPTGVTVGADYDTVRISGQKTSGEQAARERPHPETRDEARQELANRNRSRREQKGDQNT